jgi:hypothetical protein
VNDPTAKTTAEWPGIEETAGLLNLRIGEWHDFGYATPPALACKTIPPLGERTAEAIKAGHGAIEVIDEIVRDLRRLREQLARELRADQDARAGAATRQEAEAGSTPVPGSSPAAGLKDELGRLRRSREAWEETARTCVCPPGVCTRAEFRDHAGKSGDCMVYADRAVVMGGSAGFSRWRRRPGPGRWPAGCRFPRLGAARTGWRAGS